jgi:PAS domain S-box-containing protein
MLLLLCGSLLPWVANFLFIFRLNPFPYLDLTPFAFTVTGMVVGWGVLRFKFLDILPIARDAVVEGLRDAIIVLDVHNRVVDLNRAAQQMLGYASHKVIGQPAQEIFSDYAELQAQYGSMDDVQVELIRGEGDAQHIYELRISPLVDRHGQIKGRLVGFSDITERKRVEWSLRESETALRQYAAELEAQNDELDAFAHTVAHDLKGPLGLLLGYSSLLDQAGDELEAESFHQSTRAIAQNTRKMSNIINELLLLASVRKMDEVDIVPLAMGVIVDEVLQRLADAIESSQADISVPETWSIALGYAPWIEEVWANYISNAIKYGGKPPRITLGAMPDPENDAMVRFWVQDNGDGLTMEQRASLFTPFERLKQVRAKGHGLGLSIVRRIIEKLEGKVGIESDAVAGEGCTFYFSLPKA